MLSRTAVTDYYNHNKDIICLSIFFPSENMQISVSSFVNKIIKGFPRLRQSPLVTASFENEIVSGEIGVFTKVDRCKLWVRDVSCSCQTNLTVLVSWFLAFIQLLRSHPLVFEPSVPSPEFTPSLRPRISMKPNTNAIPFFAMKMDSSLLYLNTITKRITRNAKFSTIISTI